MEDALLESEMGRRGAIVVHFSHHANMREGGQFPADLRNAIADPTLALSCSVLWPGHRMTPCGSVGVMFKPRVADVLSVSGSDSGSSAGAGGVDRSLGVPLTEESFPLTFQVSGAYNEWRVRGARVAGIFVHNVYDIQTKKERDIPGMPDGQTLREICHGPTPLAEVFDAFPGQRVFTMTGFGLVELAPPA